MLLIIHFKSLYKFKLCISYRNPTRSWALIFTYLGKCLASIYFVNICFTNFIIPFYSELDYSNISIKQLIYSIFPSACSGLAKFLFDLRNFTVFNLGSVCLFVGIFYGLLHSCRNNLIFIGIKMLY